MKFRFLAGLAAGLIALAVPAIAAPPQVQVVGPTDLFQDVVGGAAQVGNVYASALQLAGYMGSLAAKGNVLIGGDASTNLFQRATTGASVTTTLTYGGPDRWAYWSGTSTAMTVSRDTTAADLPATSYQAAFKMARTSGQTGVVQMCMAQEVETVNAYQYQGQTAELDFHAVAGANYSSAASALTAYIITGTGTDEGLSKMAFFFNGGGGGSSTWAGQATTVADVATISTTVDRYAAVGVIPAGTTEIAVMFCYTPVGTAGTNDYVALSGIQLVRNAALNSIAAATTAASCSAGVVTCTSFDRRLQGVETMLQQRYYYQITESATAIQGRAMCASSTTSLTNCYVRFPTTMRIAPTMTYATGFETSSTTASTGASACSALATSTTLTGNASSPEGVIVACTASVGAAGSAGFLWDVGTGTPGGRVNASAEL